MPEQNPGVWGIDVGQCALKAIRLEVIDGQATATAFDYVEHPKILSQPDADPDALTREALEKFLSRNVLKGDQVAISVPGQSGLARFVKLPPVEEKKIPDIVRFEAKQQIPFPLEEVVWDYQKIGAGTVTDGFAMETEIGLFALKRDMVSRALQHFRDVNVEVHVVQMAPLSLCNFVAYDLLHKDPERPGGGGAEDDDGEKKGGRNCIVALDIGTDNSNLVVSDGEKIIWQRPIPFGGNHFTRALTKDLKLTFAKAEHLKRNATKSPDLKKILAALKPVLNDFAGEVQRSLGYFTNTHRSAQIEYMIGLGNAFRLPGLQKFLSEKLSLDVRKLGQFERVGGDGVISAPSFSQNIMSFAPAYGLALQTLELGRIRTNLLPPEIRMERMIRAKKPFAVSAAAALLVGVLATTVHYALAYRAVAASSVLAEEGKADQVAKRFQAEIASFQAKDAEVNAKVASVRNVLGPNSQRADWVVLNKFIDDCLPLPGKVLAGKFKTSDDKELIVMDTNGADHHFVIDDVMVIAKGKHGVDPGELKPDTEVQVVYNDADGEAKQFWNKPAQEAFLKWWDRQVNGRGGDVKAQDEWAKDLMQVNIETITPLYSWDLKTFQAALLADPTKGARMLGMTEKDKKNPPTDPKDGDKGWVVELRGYTFHKDQLKFLLATLVDSLNRRAGNVDTAAPAQPADQTTGAPAAAPPQAPAAAVPPPAGPSAPKPGPIASPAPPNDASNTTAKSPVLQKPPSPPTTGKAPDGKQPATKTDGAPPSERDVVWDGVIKGKVSHAVLYDYKTVPAGDAHGIELPSIVNRMIGGAPPPAAPPGPGEAVLAFNWGSLLGKGGGTGALVGGGPARRGAQPPASGKNKFERLLNAGGPATPPPTRGSDAPQGPMASKAKAQGAPRTEFVILFVWREPTGDAAAK
jgi:type IV pilus assembly protein PilM